MFFSLATFFDETLCPLQYRTDLPQSVPDLHLTNADPVAIMAGLVFPIFITQCLKTFYWLTTILTFGSGQSKPCKMPVTV